MMTRLSVLLSVALVVLIAGAAYLLFVPPATQEDGAGLPAFLTGEMRALKAVSPAEAAPGQIFMAADGSPLTLSDRRGTAMLVNFWASWCAPCRAEMKELANLQTALGGSDFEVVAINVDRGGLAEAEETLAEWGIEGLALYAEPTMKMAAEVAEGALPTSLVINRNGLVIARYRGPLKWDAPEAITLFRALKEGRL
ncbi:TlpA disulfide reductase family protein [Eilatimonas milleporae]|uniref:Thiol-disulfide isomerase/thioredoxin n=1 Tax=Eilatimonas milleporae TaxID=911205 RepID=A0A3M0BYY9_9PROT|nr:TlpA disulfide reductase family protein [Eilatimonas milleporae]RMB02698.1 thiol-disulfide isomerase/thioredoxin [Eilatimonas milleporae]